MTLIIEDEPFQNFCYGRYIEPVQVSLSPMELKVFNFRKAGYRNYQIASRLDIREKDVSSYVQSIKQKGWKI